MSIPLHTRPFGEPNVFGPMETGAAIECVWPSLYVGATRVPEMQRKVRTLEWARKAIARWQAEAERVLGEPPAFLLDNKAGGRCALYTEAGHYLSYRTDGSGLLWDPFGKEPVAASPAAIEAQVVLCHERTRRLMSSLAFLWRLTGDERYSRWVWEGLRNTAALYHNGAAAARGTDEEKKREPYTLVYGGLYQAQALLETVQALELVEGAPGGGEADRRSVVEEVLLPSGEKISAWMDVMQVHNMSVWGMAALAETGRCTGRADWVHKALHSDRCGLRLHLERGVPRNAATGAPDGFWFEHSHFYGCFYVTAAIIPLVRAAEDAGLLDDDLRARFRSLFDAPPHLADETLRLLTVSDRAAPDLLRLTQMRYLYEYAAGQVDSAYAPLLALLYARGGAPRDSLAAMAFGPDALPEPDAPETLRRSAALPEAQLATFRGSMPQGPVTLWFANLKRYPGSAQGHHHMDKLAVSLHACGKVVTSDLGWPGCEQDAVRVNFLSGTLSHNTLLLNETDQGTVADQTFGCDVEAHIPWARGSFRGCTADSLWKTFLGHHHGRLEEGLYDDAVLTRTVWFDLPYIVLLDELDAKSAKRLGFVFHSRGLMVAGGDPAPSPPLGLLPLTSDGAWSCFGGRVTADPLRRFCADWRLRADLFLRLVTVSDGPFDAAWGHTPDNPAEIRRGTVVLRAPGARRRFATVLEVHEGTPSLADVAVDGDTVCLHPADAPARTYR